MTQVTCSKCGTANNTSDMGYCWKCQASLASAHGSAAERFALFPNGTSFMMWLDRNCDQCVKCYDENKHKGGRSDCDIENAIALASATDGTLLHGGYTPMNKAKGQQQRVLEV
jgi:hypothetical protein